VWRTGDGQSWGSLEKGFGDRHHSSPSPDATDLLGMEHLNAREDAGQFTAIPPCLLRIYYTGEAVSVWAPYAPNSRSYG
jgi:hypothetical protein